MNLSLLQSPFAFVLANIYLFGGFACLLDLARSMQLQPFSTESIR
jgi:hypothetical protein